MLECIQIKSRKKWGRFCFEANDRGGTKSPMQNDAFAFIAIAIVEFVAIFALLQRTARLWPRIGSAFVVALFAALARNLYFGPGIDRETVRMALIHGAFVTVIFTVLSLLRRSSRG